MGAAVDLIQAISVLIVAVGTMYALHQWKAHVRSLRRTRFLSETSRAVAEYLGAMYPALDVVENIRTGIERARSPGASDNEAIRRFFRDVRPSPRDSASRVIAAARSAENH